MIGKKNRVLTVVAMNLRLILWRASRTGAFHANKSRYHSAPGSFGVYYRAHLFLFASDS